MVANSAAWEILMQMKNNTTKQEYSQTESQVASLMRCGHNR